MSVESRENPVLCQHCHHMTFNDGSVSSSPISSSDYGSRPKPSLQEALVGMPYDKTAILAQPVPIKRTARSKASVLLAKATNFLPLPGPVIKKYTLKNNPSSAPTRPQRPPVQQCPPDVGDVTHFPRARDHCWTPVQNQLLARPGCDNGSRADQCLESSNVFSTSNPEPVATSPCEDNEHLRVAYKLLTGEDAGSVTSSTRTPDKGREKGYEEDGTTAAICQPPGFWYASESFSTLPTTGSKVALRPSPLRPSSSGVRSKICPVGPRSSIQDSCAESAVPTLAPQLNSFSKYIHLTLAETRSSSYTTASVYSSDDNRVQELNTPPSSSPPVPIRSQSRCATFAIDADRGAEGLQELSDISDSYGTCADSPSTRKRDVPIDDKRGHWAHLSALARVPTQKLSRTQKRIAKERDRNTAATQLSSHPLDSEAQDAEFEQWLQFVSRHESSGTRPEEKRPIPELYLQLESATLDMLYEISEEETNGMATPEHSVIDHAENDAELERTADFRQNKPDIDTTTSTSREPSASLQQLRTQLLALMDDNQDNDECGDGRETLPATPSASRTPSAATPLTAGSHSLESVIDSDCAPILQRIEIEWKGRRYPVLIGAGGRIWEGPCSIEGCTGHPGRKDHVAHIIS